MASPRLLAVPVLLSLLACAPSRVDEAARIINGLTQATVFDGTIATEIPPLKCDGNSYLYNFEAGGTSLWTGTATPTTATFDIEFLLNVKGDSIFYPNSADDPPSLKCKLTARYAFNPGTLRATGKGTITTCDGFWCEVSGQRISCKDLMKALATLDCG